MDSDDEMDNVAIAGVHYVEEVDNLSLGDMEPMNIGFGLASCDVEEEDELEEVLEDEDEVVEDEEEVIEISDDTPDLSATNPMMKGKTAARDAIDNNTLVMFHLDVETGGEQVGVVQFSCVAFDVGTKKTTGTFDRYVKPPTYVKHKHWNKDCQEITGIAWNDERLKSAKPIT